MHGDEEHRVVVAEDRVRPVAVMHVPVDDRDTFDAELPLCDARRNGDVVEDAEAHRALPQRVMPRRAHEREAAVERRLDRGAGGEHRGLVRRVGRHRVVVEPLRRLDARALRDVLRACGRAGRRPRSPRAPPSSSRNARGARRAARAARDGRRSGAGARTPDASGRRSNDLVELGERGDAGPRAAEQVTEERRVRARAARVGREPASSSTDRSPRARARARRGRCRSRRPARLRALRATRSRDGG